MGCSPAAIVDATCQRSKGTTPAELWGSGATHMFLASEDIARVQWRGRWAQLKTVEYYIQEVAAQILVAKLDPLSKLRIRILASASGALLKLFLSLIAKAIDERKRGPFSCFNEHQP